MNKIAWKLVYLLEPTIKRKVVTWKTRRPTNQGSLQSTWLKKNKKDISRKLPSHRNWACFSQVFVLTAFTNSHTPSIWFASKNRGTNVFFIFSEREEWCYMTLSRSTTLPLSSTTAYLELRLLVTISCALARGPWVQDHKKKRKIFYYHMHSLIFRNGELARIVHAFTLPAAKFILSWQMFSQEFYYVNRPQQDLSNKVLFQYPLEENLVN